jgi:hypothetical protein
MMGKIVGKNGGENGGIFSQTWGLTVTQTCDFEQRKKDDKAW